MNRPPFAAVLLILLAGSFAQAQLSTSTPTSRPTTLPTTRAASLPAASLYLDYFTKPSQGHRDRALASLTASPALSKADADHAAAEVWSAYRQSPEAILRTAASAHGFVMSGDEPLTYVLKTTGDRGPNGYAVFIDLHGGGEAPPEVNDRDWLVHQSRYTVPGKFVALRAPRDTWDHFHHEYFHAFMDRLVEQLILTEDVDPNRVYLMGYSSGGYGVIQLAPSMPDRFAAAACSAAATEGSRPENLRDLPFIYQLGENDTMYDRGRLSRAYGAQLATLHADDPDGYDFVFHLVAGRGHGFDDRGVVPWLAARTREPYPTKIVWWQNQPGRASSNPIRHQFYWIGIDEAFRRDESGLKTVVATRDGQHINLTVDGYASLHIRLNDAMVDLDRPVRVTINGREVLNDRVPRRAETMLRTFLERKDPTYAFAAEVTLEVPRAITGPNLSLSAEPAREFRRRASDMNAQEVAEPALHPAPIPTSPRGTGERDQKEEVREQARLALALARTDELRDDVREVLIRAGDRAAEFEQILVDADPLDQPNLAYLLITMPDFDRPTISTAMLMNNARLAREAATRAPWASQIDPDMFENYVLPYANIDERRDDWRPKLYEQLREAAWKHRTPLEAARWINDHFEELFGVVYNAQKRPKPDQSPFEAMEAKYASCTGLSILMVDACRAVGIPARMVGVPSWTQIDGNHNWVEVWDGQWMNIGSSGTDPRDDDWVDARAREQTDPDRWMNSVYALSWRDTATHFPIIWKLNQRELSALNITRFYSHRLAYKLQVPGDADVTVSVYWAGELLVRKRGHGAIELPLASGCIFKLVIRQADGDGSEETRELRT